MIIRSDGRKGLLLIRQPDHAGLAARIMTAWRPSDFLPPASRAAVLYAIAEHDNGWLELDEVPTLDPDSRRPCDFMTVPLHFKQVIWPRGVARLAASDPHAAALVAQHGLSVHGHRRAEPGWEAFFAEVERLRDDLLVQCGADAGTSHDAFRHNYDLLFMGDLLSLVFCNRWTDPVDSRGYRAVFRDDQVVVSPDPFEGRKVRLEVAARRIPDRPYPSQADLRAAWHSAERVTIAGTARGV